MEEKGIKKNAQNDDVPIASIVINEYKGINKQLKESNTRLSILALILLILLAIETTYIILYWDTLHPHAGMIQEKCNE